MKEPFKPTSESQAAKEKLWDLILSRVRGQLITYDEVEQATGYIYGEGRFRSVIVWARNRCIKEELPYLIIQKCVGVSLATIDEQLRIQPYMARKSERCARRGRRAPESLPYAELSLHQATLKDAQVEAAREIERKAHEQAKRAEFLLRPKAPDPVRVRLANPDEPREQAKETA